MSEHLEPYEWTSGDGEEHVVHVIPKTAIHARRLPKSQRRQPPERLEGMLDEESWIVDFGSAGRLWATDHAMANEFTNANEWLKRETASYRAEVLAKETPLIEQRAVLNALEELREHFVNRAEMLRPLEWEEAAEECDYAVIKIDARIAALKETT